MLLVKLDQARLDRIHERGELEGKERWGEVGETEKEQ